MHLLRLVAAFGWCEWAVPSKASQRGLENFARIETVKHCGVKVGWGIMTERADYHFPSRPTTRICFSIFHHPVHTSVLVVYNHCDHLIKLYTARYRYIL
jgi:hypothetical protein